MKICIADGQSRVRYGLILLLEQQPGWEVTGEAACADELVKKIVLNPPDLILIDWELPGMPLDKLLISLRLIYPYLKIIALSGRYELRQEALAARANGFASKAEPPEKLIQLIGQVMKE